MKKILLSLVVLSVISSVNAQVIYSAADSTDFAAWTAVDQDGDGNNWSAVIINNPAITAPGFDGTDGYLSNSWSTNPLTPDNVGVSPVIDCSGESTVYVNWLCGSPETTASGWYEEKYAVYVILTSDIAAILAGGALPTPVFETTLSAGETWFAESVDISSIAGNQASVHVILRHYDCTDENWILVDGLEVSSSSVSIEENSLTVGVYPNPAADVLNVTSSNELSTVTIIGMDGKVISTTDVNGSNASIEISTLNAGVYFYEVLTVDGTIRNTFVKK
ncbi:T9SS type A sorting domain-containing protein [Crocinitomicaceae bacterium]|nr:T9SS type A sorting domain-containing protein [Crocinitomicaceae bacterium]MDC1385235.1 T9SS type A sorting domain-containing protein [Crocinitomicaceae bacterium]